VYVSILYYYWYYYLKIHRYEKRRLESKSENYWRVEERNENDEGKSKKLAKMHKY